MLRAADKADAMLTLSSAL